MKRKIISGLLAVMLCWNSLAVTASANTFTSESTEVLETANNSIQQIDENQNSKIATTTEQDCILKASDQTITGECGQNVHYELNRHTGLLRIYGSGPMKDTQEDDADGTLWDDYSSDVRQVRIEDGVTRIGSRAFGSTYGKYYFPNLTSVEMADSVVEIGEEAFRYCTNLDDVKMSENAKVIERWAFEYCSNLTNIQFPENVTEIGWGAFRGSGLAELDIPSSIQSIGVDAFYGCNQLKCVEIPENCKIYGSAFAYCESLKQIRIGKNCKIWGGAFRENPLLEDISIGEGNEAIYNIEDYGTLMYSRSIFENCNSLKNILLPDSWGFEGAAYASQFQGCDNLTEIRFSEDNNKYQIIDDVIYSKDGKKIVFYPPGLVAREYKIRDGVTKIGDGAFYYQRYLEYIEFPSTVSEFGSWAFYGCALKKMIIPDGVTELPVNGFPGSLDTVVIPPSVREIPENYKESMSAFVSQNIKAVYGEPGSAAQEWADLLKKDFRERVYCNFDANGGTVVEDRKVVIPGDVYHSLPTPTWANHEFLGWYTEKEGGQKITRDTEVSQEVTHTLYAHWEGVSNPNELNLDNLSYSFSNYYRSFGYSEPYYIPYNIFALIFGDNTRAKYYYNDEGEWGGSCYGMASSSGMFNSEDSELTVGQFNSLADRVWDLTPKDRNRASLSITQLIEAMQISQIDESIQKAYRNTRNNLQDLYDEVKNVEDNGKAITVAVFGPEGGHALLGYKLEKISKTKTYLHVYDCNFPGIDRYITLTTDASGTVKGWYYPLNDIYDWGSNYAGCWIAYVTYSKYNSMWENRAVKHDSNILFLNTEDFSIYDYKNKKVAIIKDGELTTDNQDIFLMEKTEITEDNSQKDSKESVVFLPADVYTVKNDDISVKEFQASMVDEERGAAVVTSSNEVTLAVDDASQMNAVTVFADSGDTYEMKLDSTVTSDCKTIEVKGTGTGEKVSVSQMQDMLSLNNCDEASITIDGTTIGQGQQGIDISDAEVHLSYTSVPFDGTTKEPELTVKMGNTVLTAKKDYIVMFSGNQNVGIAKVYVYGIGAYSGVKEETFEITAADTSVTGVKSVKLSATKYTYNGKAKKPSVTVINGDGEEVSSQYYTVSYAKGRKNVGQYKVTVKFKGDYSGTVTKTFSIVPKGTSIKKLTAQKKGFKAVWKKQATQTSGYQIQYATNSKFESAKTKTVNGSKKTSATVSKLKLKKKYYVRIRTYKTVNVDGESTKICSSWSKAKKVKTK